MLSIALLLFPLLPAQTNYAQGRKPSASVAETERLQKALGQALDRLADDDAKLKAATEAIDALRAERDAANTALAASKGERESLERQVVYAQQAVDAQVKVIAIYEKTIAMQGQLLDRHEKRIDALETKLDKANGRVVKSGVLGFVAGALTSLLAL
jgi:chromosome segregation ATPase